MAEDNWFVVNVRDAPWVHHPFFGDACIFEGDDVEFAHIGYTLAVIEPGRPSGMYHCELADQEDFLVLAGECLCLIEGEERRLGPGDFVHCPPGTDHIFVGAGDGPCVIFMAGSRRDRKALVYPREELALQHGAGVEAETTQAREAYARFEQWTEPGPPRPGALAALPWD